MNVLAMTLLFLVAAWVPAAPQERAPANWKLFVSETQHFSVVYPGSWNRLLGADGRPINDGLEIINFPNRERVTGVVIKKGGANISVVGLAPDSTPFGWHTVDDWIRFSVRHRIVIDQSEISVAGAAPTQCTTLKRVVSEIPTSGDAYQIDTSYYCTAGGWLYSVSEGNWKGDPHQNDLQEIALQVVLSLRSR